MVVVQAKRTLLPLAIALLMSAAPTAATHETDHEEHHLTGMLACGVSGFGSIQGNPCRPFNDANHKNQFDVPFRPNLTSLVLFIDVEPSLATTSDFEVIDPELDLHAFWVNPPGDVIPSVTGTSPLQAHFEFSGDEGWNSYDRTARLVVDLDKDTFQFTYYTEIDVRIGLFYNGAEVPDGYVPGGDE